MLNRKEHWEKVFATKQETEVGWYEPKPKTSISFFTENNIPKEAKIIDVGGGDSYLIDNLLELGYSNLFLLDISANAIKRIKNRLGAKAEKVIFIVSDVLDFQPDTAFDVWHDRASFHFLTSENEISRYKKLVSNSITENGILFLGTFSESGPLKCSGLEITQYSESKFDTIFASDFEKLNCFTANHNTPFDTIQNFIFCTYKKNNMFSELKNTIKSITEISVTNERKEVLNPLIDYIQGKVNSNKEIRLNFICTHNSRRSHLSQIWAQTMAFKFGIKNVFCYSGGTEATAMFPKVAETLVNQGFQIQKLSQEQNPVYAVKFSENQHPIVCFSKAYYNEFNPKSQFGAIMTCNNADEGCPMVFGAEARFPIKYDDPKAFDGTDLMNSKYAERSLEIASEMYFVFSQIKK